MPTVSASGDRSLFFTHVKDEPEWRLTEKVAAVLEGNFVGSENPFFTFSTAKVPNGTPYPPPMDVVYALTPDPDAAFAFVQVRDRPTEKVTREYIDAVLGQRFQTGVQSCVVVSTVGFTRDALALAESQGIVLRILSRECVFPYEGYLPASLSVSFEPFLCLKEAVLILTRPGAHAKLPLNGAELLRSNLLLDGQATTLTHAFNLALASDSRQREIDDMMRQNPDAQYLTVAQQFEQSSASARTIDGPATVGAIVYRAEIVRPEVLEEPVTRRYVYHDPLVQRNIAWCVVADFAARGDVTSDQVGALHHFCLWRFPRVDGADDSIGGAFFAA